LTFAPDTDFQDPLKLFGQVVPSIVVAEGMGWQVVLYGMRTAAGVRQDVVGLPVASDRATAYMAPTGGFRENYVPL
jgi:hypothetical protein